MQIISPWISLDRGSLPIMHTSCVGAIDPLDQWHFPPHIQRAPSRGLSECALVLDPRGRRRKIGDLPQALQRGSAAWPHRRQSYDPPAISRWRTPTATVIEAGKLHPRSKLRSRSKNDTGSNRSWMKIQWQVRSTVVTRRKTRLALSLPLARHPCNEASIEREYKRSMGARSPFGVTTEAPGA